ncbi:DUF1077-domain-containing protein [Neocallimastix lanati (nom. inval.)]|uniref:ER membrane protein complex subunit 4 n=1 Tax=Neocallimastix californiae TaxID=1754190 RepID=A0A1Y2FRF9_9FUNG|nr:DUF1077-domain-containing protein [Neocallimastix sp. JGI-2020a]ORY86590.1 DUF1077-domain-containing protein [Neocallimastix californiae]|eukprot:ORY86590.1 DUF1077-domain-containing protein [Neocallimastix californiae]
MENPWALNYKTIDTSSRIKANSAIPAGFVVSKSEKFNRKRVNNDQQQSEQNDIQKLKVKRAYEKAFNSVKGIFMNVIMMFMSGNSINQFTIIIVGMLLSNPIKALKQTNEVFKEFEEENGDNSFLLKPKLTYIALSIAQLLVGLYKCASLGILPTTTSDWLTFEEPKTFLESVHGGTTL